MLDFGFYNCDCLPEMKKYPDKYFNLAIVDPPYGINVTGRHKAKSNTIPLGGGVGSQDLSAVHGGYGNGRPKIGGDVTMKGMSRSSKSHLNFTIRSMILRHRTRNTLKNYSEFQRRR